MSSSSGSVFDVKAILVTVISSAILSLGPMVYMMGQVDVRINNLEQQSPKYDKLTESVQSIQTNVAIMATDLAYVKDNVKELKSNTDALSMDVSKIRSIVNSNEMGGGYAGYNKK